MKRKLLFVFGTRPETIKLFPVIRAARERSDEFDTRVCVTGQHREMADTFLELFDIRADSDLDIMETDQTLSGVCSRVLERMDPVLERESPDWVVVQGDTTSTMAASLAAFHLKVPVGHIEAGLRTWDMDAPYPEEMNRQVTSRIATLHFAPTSWARDNLSREGVPEDRIEVTGNTVIDALYYTRDHMLSNRDMHGRFEWLDKGKRLVLVTGHRRESFGHGMENLCMAVRDILDRHEDIEILYPVHLNPHVREPVDRLLGPAVDTGRLHLEAPVDYLDFVSLLDRCHLVITDSGGVQEEAPAFGKPVLCTRDRTERPEGVDAGTVRLVGTDRERIVAAADELLTDTDAYLAMSQVRNPYGDGRASERILDSLSPSSG